jgi:hypothetical protein
MGAKLFRLAWMALAVTGSFREVAYVFSSNSHSISDLVPPNCESRSDFLAGIGHWSFGWRLSCSGGSVYDDHLSHTLPAPG